MTALGAEGFSDIARRADRYGEAVDGPNLRTSAKAASVVCEYCGPLDASLMGWTSDWITLRQEAIGHVQDTGHRVAVECYQAAVYGPEHEDRTQGNTPEEAGCTCCQAHTRLTNDPRAECPRCGHLNISHGGAA